MYRKHGLHWGFDMLCLCAGHVNHTIFWQNLAPPKEGGGEPPEGNLASAIESEFGSLDKLIAKMSTTGAGVQGSGWVVYHFVFELLSLHFVFRC
jgi:superoxide dismutase